jgi:hypothetical protein
MISEADTDKYLAEILDILKERFEAGDKSALLYAIYHCLLMKRPLPEWLRLKFLHAYEAHARFEMRSSVNQSQRVCTWRPRSEMRSCGPSS